MIVPMKKAHIICIDHHKEGALNRLGSIGVVHVDVNRGREASETLVALEDRRRVLQLAIAELSQDTAQQHANHPYESVERSMELARTALAKVDEIRLHSDRLEELQKDRGRLGPWGDIDPEDVEFIRNHGVDVRIFTVNKDILSSLPDDFVYIPVWFEASRSGILTFGPIEA